MLSPPQIVPSLFRICSEPCLIYILRLFYKLGALTQQPCEHRLDDITGQDYKFYHISMTAVKCKKKR